MSHVPSLSAAASAWLKSRNRAADLEMDGAPEDQIERAYDAIDARAATLGESIKAHLPGVRKVTIYPGGESYIEIELSSDRAADAAGRALEDVFRRDRVYVEGHEVTVLVSL